MSFDEIYSPGFAFDPSQTDATLDGYVEQIFAGAAGGRRSAGPGERRRGADADGAADDARRRRAKPTTASCPRPRWGGWPGTR